LAAETDSIEGATLYQPPASSLVDRIARRSVRRAQTRAEGLLAEPPPATVFVLVDAAHHPFFYLSFIRGNLRSLVFSPDSR
jgi:hypothetical protein